ncbi:putative bacteriophage excisionase [Rhodococcus sp. AW25M09]|uniref:DUF2637 domain-containing protein n=1 Tax=Rhodococcus sp. AW25M09 TaxID=1268303 RepID=UPI0002AC30F2|nr:DUF2637 domain-containing protein [Rhodococcus sp. AW25M09]CCQ14838.1 putative bacteriophage excisionase [Rhodococcus sp. AW25M09]
MNKVLRATLVSAVVITTVIGIASFVLSFAALWDLATMAGVPRSLSWLWPVIVDGTILQATISVIALAQFEDQRSGRRFFWGVLITAALVSIGANAMHAFISEAGTLHPALSAAIATVAPVSLLAATHGLGILVRIPAELPKAIDVPDTQVPASEERATDERAADERAADERVAVAPRVAPAAPAPRVPTPEISVPAQPVRSAPLPDREPIEPVRIEQPVPPASARTVEPLDEVDRWILDEERVDDLYPVDAP